MAIRLIIFLILNFLALGLGSYFTGDGVLSEWYANLNKAPWTPPGWVFGAAWTTIMICFAIYMARAYDRVVDKQRLLIYFGIQWFLNVSWNPMFFAYHQVAIALINIVALTILLFGIFFRYRNIMGQWSYLLLPYMIWLCIATSLNLYILVMN